MNQLRELLDQPELAVLRKRLREYVDLDYLLKDAGVFYRRTRDGREQTTDCPFCGSPSFIIDEREGLWECTDCSRRGDGLEFLILKNFDGDSGNGQIAPSPATWFKLDTSIAPIHWEWNGWLARGQLTMVTSEAGQGKSALVLRVAACYLRADSWPDGTPFQGETGRILWAEAEAAQAINLERAKQWGLPLDRIVSPLDDPLADVRLDNLAHREAIADLLHQDDIRLMVLDCLRGAHAGDENSSDIVSIGKWLAELARDMNKPILLTHHLRKRGILDSGDGISLDRVRGSSAIVQLPRLIWTIDAPNPLHRERKRLSVIKSNLARFPEPVGFTISEKGVAFTTAPTAPHRENLMDRTGPFLQELLKQGPVLSEEVKARVQDAGLSWATAKKTKQDLGICSVRKGGKWFWSFEAGDAHQSSRFHPFPLDEPEPKPTQSKR